MYFYFFSVKAYHTLEQTAYYWLFMLAVLTKTCMYTVYILQYFMFVYALSSWLLLQVLWEMLTREIPFKGLEGLQVAWLVVEKNEV